MVNSGAQVLTRSTLVASNATAMVEAIKGCVVMVIDVIAVVTPTVTSAVNGSPEARSCSICLEGNLRNSESSDDDLPS